MREGGFSRSFIQIREKIKQLKKKYKKVKDNNSLSDRSRKTFQFFDRLDEVMGDRPITRPPCLLDIAGDNSDDGKRDGELLLEEGDVHDKTDDPLVDESEDSVDEQSPSSSGNVSVVNCSGASTSATNNKAPAA